VCVVCVVYTIIMFTTCLQLQPLQAEKRNLHSKSFVNLSFWQLCEQARLQHIEVGRGLLCCSWSMMGARLARFLRAVVSLDSELVSDLKPSRYDLPRGVVSSSSPSSILFSVCRLAVDQGNGS